MWFSRFAWVCCKGSCMQVCACLPRSDDHRRAESTASPAGGALCAPLQGASASTSTPQAMVKACFDLLWSGVAFCVLCADGVSDASFLYAAQLTSMPKRIDWCSSTIRTLLCEIVPREPCYLVLSPAALSSLVHPTTLAFSCPSFSLLSLNSTMLGCSCAKSDVIGAYGS